MTRTLCFTALAQLLFSERSKSAQVLYILFKDAFYISFGTYLLWRSPEGFLETGSRMQKFSLGLFYPPQSGTSSMLAVPTVAVVHIPTTHIRTVLKIRVTTIPYWVTKGKENATSILITYTHRIKCIISRGFFLFQGCFWCQKESITYTCVLQRTSTEKWKISYADVNCKASQRCLAFALFRNFGWNFHCNGVIGRFESCKKNIKHICMRNICLKNM